MRTRLIQAAYEVAVAEGRYEAPKTRRAPSRPRLYRDGRLTLLAPYFDYAYYAFENPEFHATGLDELEHFNFFGWRELRNPAPWFDTGYYLASNPDVLASGDNPFWHYVLKGRAEGRAPRRPRAAERAILDGLAPPETRLMEAAGAADLPRLGADALTARLAAALAGAEGLIYSFGEGEIEALPGRGFVRLQGRPARGAPIFKSMPAAWSETLLSLDGETLGVAADAALAEALTALADVLPPRRVFIVRGLLGASVDGLLAIEAALAPDRRLFWLDDFSSLCPSSRLLRNDVAFCGAPPPDSQACAICIYGEARQSHLAAAARLFERCRFTVVAPSETALALWRRAAALPCEAEVVAASVGLHDLASPSGAVEFGEIGGEARPLRAAFIGPPSLVGGWLTFERILEACGEFVAYAFHHFAAAAELRPSRNLVSVEAAGSLRDLLVERRIDLVVRPSEGPEAFSLASVEALAAGCDLVTLRHSGHAAALIEAERRGRIFGADDELVEFFAGGKAIAYARERERFPRHVRDVRDLSPLARLIA